MLERWIPRRAAARWTKTRRDLSALSGPLRGRAPLPFSLRDGDGWPEPVLATRTLRVETVTTLTDRAVCITLVSPLPIAWRPGQFLTVRVPTPQGLLPRAYSLCGDPAEQRRLQIAVKRVAGGRASTWLTQQLEPGAKLTVLGPSGDYGVTPGQAPRELLLISGGSGITPNLAIARGVLATEPDTRVTLLYANTSRSQVMFADVLEQLEAEHGERFRVLHWLERGGKGARRGRLTADALHKAWTDLDVSAEVEAFVCGPEAMTGPLCEAMLDLGLPAEQLHLERFTPGPEASGVASRVPQQLVVRRGGVQTEAVVEPGQTLLEAAVSAGAELPYSCGMGGCGACRCRKLEGEVVLDQPNCLTPEEVDAGWLLTCVSRPQSDVVVEIP